MTRKNKPPVAGAEPPTTTRGPLTRRQFAESTRTPSRTPKPKKVSFPPSPATPTPPITPWPDGFKLTPLEVTLTTLTSHPNGVRVSITDPASPTPFAAAFPNESAARAAVVSHFSITRGGGQLDGEAGVPYEGEAEVTPPPNTEGPLPRFSRTGGAPSATSATTTVAPLATTTTTTAVRATMVETAREVTVVLRTPAVAGLPPPPPRTVTRDVATTIASLEAEQLGARHRATGWTAKLVLPGGKQLGGGVPLGQLVGGGGVVELVLLMGKNL